MALTSLSDLSITDANNTSFSGITQAENAMLPSDVNGAFRATDGSIARYLSDLAGINQTVGGTANAITVTVAQTWTALANGQRMAIKNTVGPNTGATTISVTNSVAGALGTKAIRLQGDSALVGGEMLANGIYEFRYDTSYNAAAGAWVLIGAGAYLPLTGGTLTGNLSITRTGAADTVLALSTAAGQSDFLRLATNGVTRWDIFKNQTLESGSNAGSDFAITRYNDAGTGLGVPIFIPRATGAVQVERSLYTANATGADKGADTFNTKNYYKDGLLVNPGLVLLTSGSVSAAATLDIVLTAYTGYRGLRVMLTNWLPATSSTDLYLRFSTDGGSTYLTTGYLYAVNRIAGGGTNNPAGGAAQAQIPMLGGAFSENTNSGIDVIIDIQGQTSTARYGKAQFRASYASGGPAQDASGSGLQATANDVDAIRLLFSSGNITSGTYALYGYP